MNFTKNQLLPVDLDVKAECICERPQTHLICIECQRSLFGRVHKICYKHPTVSFFWFSVCTFFADINLMKMNIPEKERKLDDFWLIRCMVLCHRKSMIYVHIYVNANIDLNFCSSLICTIWHPACVAVN